MPEQCEICSAELMSLTTRNVVGHQFCRTCADEIVIPLVKEYIDNALEVWQLQVAFKKSEASDGK